MLPRILCCAALGFAMVVGCEKKEETPVAPPRAIPTPTATEKSASDAMSGANEAASDAADKAADTTDAAADQTKEAGDAVADKAADAADGAANTAAAAGSDMTAEASKLIEQATTYIKENKWDLAESTVSKLEGMKASLPAEYQGQVDNVRKMLDTANAAGAVKLPGM